MIINQVLDIIVFLIIGIALLLPLSVHERENSCLDKTNMNVLKGIACVLVIISHISLQLGGKGILTLTSSVGYLAVGVFFFSSGYGLMYSFINKGNYLKGFIKKRILKILVPFWIVNIVFLLIDIVVNEQHYAYLDIVKYILGIKLICGHDWFIVFLMCFYVLFWLAGITLKRINYIIILVAVFTLFISVLIGFKIIEYGDFGKNILAFPIGMIVARYNVEIRKRIICVFPKISLLSSVLFVLTYSYYTIIKWHIGMENNLMVNYVIDFVCQMSFIVMMLMFVQKNNVKSRVTLFISGISYEVYLVHQLGLDWAKYAFQGGYEAIVIISGIIMAIALGYVFNLMMRKLWR